MTKQEKYMMKSVEYETALLEFEYSCNELRKPYKVELSDIFNEPTEEEKGHKENLCKSIEILYKYVKLPMFKKCLKKQRH